MLDKVDESREMERRYERAQILERGIFTKNVVVNATVFPHWIGASGAFWYEREKREGKEFRLVTPQEQSNECAFDHDALANALSQVSKNSVEAKDLPITELECFPEHQIRFTAFDKRWMFDGKDGSCRSLGERAETWLVSPDGRLAAFRREFNIWLRDLKTGEERALTTDGVKDYNYGSGPTVWGISVASQLQARWSPDSGQILTVLTDLTRVRTTPVLHHLPEDGDRRPAVMHYRSAFPGDENAEEYRFLAINVASGKAQFADFRPVPPCREGLAIFDYDRAGWWASDSRRAYFLAPHRGEKAFDIVEFDTTNGATRILFSETSETYVRLEPTIVTNPTVFVPLPDSEELLWWSERNGWGHLYLYDLKTGKCKNAITSGTDWLVWNILDVDEKRRELFIHTVGRHAEVDPYYRDICRVNMDSGELITVISGNCDYSGLGAPTAVTTDFGAASAVSPNHEYLVVTRARVDEIPVSYVVDRNGNEIMEIERADVSGLPEGFIWPEPVKLLSADGETDIYGAVFRPIDFSPEKRYPVVDFTYNAPYVTMTPKTAFSSWDEMKFFHPSALAQLGFIVVVIDSRGTPQRSKAFQDASYGSPVTTSHLDDHIAGIQQLAERFPYMDLDRVGIASYGYSTAIPYGLMKHPDFYKVGAVYGLEDCRVLTAVFGERFEGLTLRQTEQAERLEDLVDNLRGKLFLAQGLLDRCTPPTGYFHLVEALQKAGKEFDMLVLPKAGHPPPGYAVRRIWDYLVTHLLGAEPAREFQLESTYEAVMRSTFFEEEFCLIRD